MIPLRDINRSYSTPLVTMALIAVNVAVFLYQVTLDPFSSNHFIMEYGLIPARFHFSALVTSMFLHGGWLHLIGNMWFLWIYGDNIEDVLGRGPYLFFYLACGILAMASQMAVAPTSRIPNVGASGAIAGVMGAYLVKFPQARIVTLFWFGLIFTLDVPAVLILAYWFFLQLFSGVGSVAEASVRGGVAWFAHIGGFLAGIVLILTMRTREPHLRRADLNW